MSLVETLSARISTDRTPLAGAPTGTRIDQAWAPSSPTLSATPPSLGRRRLRLILSKFHLLPRCWSSTIRLPFFRPISLRFCPSRPVRLRLSSQSRPASNPLVALPDGVAGAGAAVLVGGAAAIGEACPPGGGAADESCGESGMLSCLFDATPVASGLA